MINLPKKFALELIYKPETGIGYQIATVKLIDGKEFKQVVLIDGQITQIRGLKDIPFSEEQIAEVILTHDKWDFKSQK